MIAFFEQPEQALLAACLSPDGALQPRRDELVQSGVNWDSLMALAARHGVRPLLFRCLEQAPKGSVPQAVLAELYAFYCLNASRNQRLAGELCALVEQFQGCNIPVLAMKGPALAAQIYGDLALRQFVDLDILIHPQDFHPAYDLLIQKVYHQIVPLSNKQEARLLLSKVELGFVFSNNPLVELHWGISLRREIYPLSETFFWQDPAWVPLAGGSVPTLAPERALLALCIHGARHEWMSWKWIADIAYLCAAYPGIDWAAVVEQYAAFGFRDIICLGFALVEAVTGQPAAPGLKGLKYSVRMDQIVKRTLLRVRPVRYWADLENSRYYSHLRERRRERMYFWLDRLIRPTWDDRKTAHLPEPFLYLTRPLRLLAEGLGGIFQKLRDWGSKRNLL